MPKEPPSPLSGDDALPPGDGSQIRDTLFLLAGDEQVADPLSAQLEHFGYVVHVFHETADAVASAANHSPAVVIADIGFAQGEFAGLEAIKHFAQGNVPSVVLSGRSDFEARLRAVNAGAKGYFAKPAQCHDLLDAIERLTNKARPAPYRILIVEDSPSQAQYYSRVLAEARMLPRVLESPSRILDSMEAFNPDLILMDMYLEGHTGSQLAQLIRQIPAHLGVPIVFLSVEQNLDKQIAAIVRGADEFLTKPIAPGQLVSVVVSKAERYRTLRSAMDRDSLTGLLNHCRLRKQLDVEAARATRKRLSLSFAMVDMDNFKEINDRYGHPAGDKVIKGLSRLLKQRLRRTDIIGRYGGEEFGIIFTDTDGERAQDVLEEARSHFANVSFREKRNRFSVTFSAGICSFVPGMKGDDLVSKADHALYRAKRGGRNRVLLG